MADVENKNAPWLGGWIIAAGMGLVAFGVSKVVGGFDFTPAAFIGLIVFLVAGLVMGMPWGAGSRPANAASAEEPAPVGHAETAPAAAAAAPVVEAAPVAASVAASVATPVAEAAPVAAVMSAPASAAGPVRLDGPRGGGAADNLKEIEGIGPAMEKMLNGLGFWHFDQLAAWSDADVAVVDGELKGFKGRITRDKWVAQAKIIVTEGLEAFRERAKTNDY